MKKMQTSVVICGAGPAGLTLAHLLGQQDVDVVLIEQLASTVTEPRAISIDGESLRTLQNIGLYSSFKDELLSGITADYVNGEGVHLFSVGGLEPQPYGYPIINSFDQPALDKHLAAQLATRNSVALHFNTTLQRFEQDDRGVRVYCHDADNNALEIDADYLVGCDGGRSSVRALLKIGMQGESNPQPWLVIDTVDPGLDEQMDCRFFCDPGRPGMTIRKRHGQRRWEWMLMPGESRENLLDDDNIRKIISPYTEADRVDIYRKRVYDFHAIIAERWRDKRVFLAGDAAHMTPPFAGQGLNSGFRDVTNLSWKLAAVVKGVAAPDILDSYETERREHAHELIETALNLGRQIQPIDAQQAAQRDAFFAELRGNSVALQAIQDDMLASLLMRSIAGGLAIGTNGESVAGRLLIQPEVTLTDGTTVLLDECLSSGFSIVGYDCDPAEVLDEDTLACWKQMGARSVAICSNARQGEFNWILDKSGKLGDWIGSDKPSILLIRPDKFCMVAAAPAAAAAELGAARELLLRVKAPG